MRQTRERSDHSRHGGIDLVVFAVGALRFAVESRHVREVVDPAADPDPRIEPMADPLCHRPGEAAPSAPALAELFGLGPAPTTAATPGPRERLLRLKRMPAPRTEPVQASGPDAATERTATADAATWDLRIQDPVSLLHCPIEALYPMPALVTALCALPCLRGLIGLDATNTEEVAILLDPGRLPETTQDTHQGTEHAEAQTSRAALHPTSSVWAD